MVAFDTGGGAVLANRTDRQRVADAVQSHVVAELVAFLDAPGIRGLDVGLLRPVAVFAAKDVRGTRIVHRVVVLIAIDTRGGAVFTHRADR